MKFNFNAYWDSVINKNAKEMGKYINDDAIIRWVSTREVFTKAQFISVNCNYPGTWRGELEFSHFSACHIISIFHIFNETESYHVTSIIKIEDEKIIDLTEYWATDKNPPSERRL